jgi:hypothetical protein
MMNEIYQDFPNTDGNFVEQFQTGGIDARIFELYLYAYLSRSGYEISRRYPQPDFLVTHNNITVALEATTVNPREPPLLTLPTSLPPSLSYEEAKNKQENELPIRFGSPLFSKLQKRYWEYEHCRGLPFVIAIEAFHEQYAQRYTSASLAHYLYGFRVAPRWTESGQLVFENAEIDTHRHSEKVIPSHFFGQPETEYISAVLFSNSGTWPKFARMGYQSGYHRGNIMMIREGLYYNPDPKAVTPLAFAYDLDDPPGEEPWGQGLIVFNNPRALHPLPRHFFVEAVDYYFDAGNLQIAAAGFHPLSSMTHMSVNEAPALTPDIEVRQSIFSILKSECEALGIQRDAETALVSEEKEWFASVGHRVIGIVIRDRVDNDWVYVLLVRNFERRFEVDEVQINIATRELARQQLLEAMEHRLKVGSYQ